MKIVIHHDNGDETVHQNITDYYLAVRTMEPRADKEGKLLLTTEVRSFSHGANLREMIKELRQSLIELQSYLSSYPIKPFGEPVEVAESEKGEESSIN